jgi:2,4-didehydro-3-deoxy-L-rhamnonate hydrolase
MRVGNVQGRLAILNGTSALDVERASGRQFRADPQAIFVRWGDFMAWAHTAAFDGAAPFELKDLGPPVPAPRQVFAISLNYGRHAAESGISAPTDEPVVFTKFASCSTGPHADILLPGGAHVYWEVELVVVIGRPARQVPESDALSNIAGFCVGQDISDRVPQMAAIFPQFGLGKSYPNFGPVGPWLTTLDGSSTRMTSPSNAASTGKSSRRDARRS